MNTYGNFRRIWRRRAVCLAAALAAIAFGQQADAGVITITSQLQGDPRPGNPDNLFVDVTIEFDDSGTDTTADWTVDINSPLHPNVKLDEFYFNLAVSASSISFGGFTPTGWDVSSPASNASGSGSADFLFKALDPSGPPNAADVTNSQPLMFTATLSSGFWSKSIFSNAADSVSSDDLLGSGQLGAHLQSLVAGPGESNSGFAFGDYVVPGPGPGPGPGVVPEPTTLAIWSLLGVCGLAVQRRKRSAKQA